MPLSWDLADPQEELEAKFRKSLTKRAKKRTGVQVGPDEWHVIGDPGLGDSYDEYIVQLADGKYHCSCQGHQGGEHRKVCSHILYVIYARRGAVDMVVAMEEEAEPPPAEYPIFVDQGQEPTEETRAALDVYFGTNPPLPDWVQLIRPTQWEALEEIVDHFSNGKKVVFVDAPTGAGKSLLGELVRRLVSPNRGIYTCSTKTLQHQIEKDFPYAAVIKGRSNYPTADNPNSDFLTADICDRSKATFPACRKDRDLLPWMDEGDEFDHCTLCHPIDACPYLRARDIARTAPLAVANVAYLVTAMNGPGFLSHEPFTVVDEADTLEDELMRLIQIEFSPRLMRRLKVGEPQRKTKPESWAEWLDDEALPALKAALLMLPSFKKANPNQRREILRFNRLINQVELMKDGIGEDWVYTGYDYKAAIFKPVRIGELARQYLWDHNKRWLLMSATIISAEQMAFDLGLKDDEWASVNVPSSFPPERRPIYVERVASVTNKTKERSWPAIASRIQEIVATYPDERVLVHTVSYALADVIVKAVGRRAVTYRNARERDGALVKFKSNPRAVLVASSFERGIDLPYDECRVVIIAKVPYPNLGDKQVSKRAHMKGGNGWYRMQTARSLVQMSGRAMRFEDDAAETYILDMQFEDRIYRESRRMLPEWWADALLFGKEADRHRSYYRKAINTTKGETH